MSSREAPAGFPNVEVKLARPVKQSAFERSKAEAEAKRKRDEAETAAVYEKFVKSFEHDEDEDKDASRAGPAPPQRPRHGFGGPPSGLNTGKRHFAVSGMKRSGPGTLSPALTSFGIKRSFNEYAKGSKDKGVPPRRQESQGAAMSVSEAFNNASDDEDEVQREAMERAELKAIAKPQLRMLNMPPGTSAAAIKALIPDGLHVNAVKIEPPAGPGSERKSTNAVITLARESPGSAMDAAVSSLQNQYLGYGYYLSVHRHLSSAVLNPVAAPASSSAAGAGQPFRAKPVEQQFVPHRSAGPHGFHRGFAPPSSYGQPGGGASRADRFEVPLAPPEDLRTLRLIHTTAERVMKHGLGFESLLKTRPEVQREERWAWLWDSRSVAGIWYRWRLWELATRYKASSTRDKEAHVYLFQDSPGWQEPSRLSFEVTTELDQLVSDPNYDSSDDEDADGEGNRGNGAGEAERPLLTPLDKAKLVHLLARLPTSLSRLRKGDVARVTVFALAHADLGAGEVVDLIVSNIGRPFACEGANVEKNQDASAEDGSSSDTSGASLIGLYVVSDILSSSSTTVFRHAWRFRGLLEKALRERQVFDYLGMMPEKQGWGRLRAEKWKRSISLVLNLWEGWCVFPGKGQELFVSTFENPPSLRVEEDKSDDASEKGKWKAVGPKPAAAGEAGPGEGDARMGDAGAAVVVKREPVDEDVEGDPIGDDDVEGEPIDEDNVEGEPIGEEDIKGEPVGAEDIKGEPMDGDEEAKEPTASTEDHDGQADGKTERPRKRMRAVDMFANSEDSEGR